MKYFLLALLALAPVLAPAAAYLPYNPGTGAIVATNGTITFTNSVNVVAPGTLKINGTNVGSGGSGISAATATGIVTTVTGISPAGTGGAIMPYIDDRFSFSEGVVLFGVDSQFNASNATVTITPAGVVTAVTYYGNGANLSGIATSHSVSNIAAAAVANTAGGIGMGTNWINGFGAFWRVVGQYYDGDGKQIYDLSTGVRYFYDATGTNLVLDITSPASFQTSIGRALSGTNTLSAVTNRFDLTATASRFQVNRTNATAGLTTLFEWQRGGSTVANIRDDGFGTFNGGLYVGAAGGFNATTAGQAGSRADGAFGISLSATAGDATSGIFWRNTTNGVAIATGNSASTNTLAAAFYRGNTNNGPNAPMLAGSWDAKGDGFKMNGTNGFTGTGNYTNFTIRGGIIINAQ
jgi:hypothetical protein